MCFDAIVRAVEIPLKKQKRLSQKALKMRVIAIVWKGIQKNTPLPSKIHSYLGCKKSYLKRYGSNVVRFVQTVTKKLVSKWVFKHHGRRGARAVNYGNRVLRKYLPLCMQLPCFEQVFYRSPVIKD